MWVRKKLDVAWADLIYGIAACFMPGRAKARHELRGVLGDSDGLFCQSARTAFDLLLRTLALPPGSEILITAITIPDMVAIIHSHRLVPVPVDLEATRLTPTIDTLNRAVRPATRMLVVTHLFGGHVDPAPFVTFARQHDLILVEDRAQAFESVVECQAGEADLVFYSFGPIKSCTAIGGALVSSRNAGLLSRMQQIQESYPPQSRLHYAKRIFKYGLLKAISGRLVYGLLNRICRCCRIDHDHLISRSARTFGERDFVTAIRRQPSAPLMRLLKRRLISFDEQRLARHAANGQDLLDALRGQVLVPGSALARHTHWLFPVVSCEPEKLIAALREAGFDATQGESLCLVQAPDDRPELSPHIARQLLDNMVFVPVYPQMPDRELSRMAAQILRGGQDERTSELDPQQLDGNRPTIGSTALLQHADGEQRLGREQ